MFTSNTGWSERSFKSEILVSENSGEKKKQIIINFSKTEFIPFLYIS